MSIMVCHGVFDYTLAVEGCAYSGAGIIRRCPVCGRLGEERPMRARAYSRRYVHRAVLQGRSLKITDECKEPREPAAQVGDIVELESRGKRVRAGVVVGVEDGTVTYKVPGGALRTDPHRKMRTSSVWLIYRPNEPSWERMARELRMLQFARTQLKNAKRVA